MSFAIYLDDASLGHRPPEGHPERPARFEAAKARLAEDDFANLPRRQPEAATRDQLEWATGSREMYNLSMYKAAARLLNGPLQVAKSLSRPQGQAEASQR